MRSEKNKNLKSVNLILNKLFKYNFNRNDCIISFGGGITLEMYLVLQPVFLKED